MSGHSSINQPLVGRTAIIGVGLMGGSIGLALRSRKISSQVVGCDSSLVLTEAIDVGAIDPDGSATEPQKAVEGADLIILAVPIHAMRGVLQAIAPYVAANAVVTDIGSIKSSIVHWGSETVGRAFIAGHPMAGSERTGVHAARHGMFDGAAWALIPPTVEPEYEAEAALRLNTLSAVVTAMGARPIITSSARHDRAAALVSHLPHLISFAYNETIESDTEALLAHNLAAGSYRDLTRVAASDPVLWRDVFLENREWLLCALERYRHCLSDLEHSILTGEPEQLLKRLQSAAIHLPN